MIDVNKKGFCLAAIHVPLTLYMYRVYGYVHGKSRFTCIWFFIVVRHCWKGWWKVHDASESDPRLPWNAESWRVQWNNFESFGRMCWPNKRWVCIISAKQLLHWLKLPWVVLLWRIFCDNTCTMYTAVTLWYLKVGIWNAN